MKVCKMEKTFLQGSQLWRPGSKLVPGVSDTLGRVKKNDASTGKVEPLPPPLSLSRIDVTSFEGGFSFPAIAPPGCQCGWQANQLVQQLRHLRH